MGSLRGSGFCWGAEFRCALFWNHPPFAPDFLTHHHESDKTNDPWDFFGILWKKKPKKYFKKNWYFTLISPSTNDLPGTSVIRRRKREDLQSSRHLGLPVAQAAQLAPRPPTLRPRFQGKMKPMYKYNSHKVSGSKSVQNIFWGPLKCRGWYVHPHPWRSGPSGEPHLIFELI
jgi:hypothetical protein